MACILWIGGRGTPRWLEGHEVHRVPGLEAALRALAGLVFDVVAVPADLPIGEQLAVCAVLRADSVHARTRVVAVPAAARQRPPRAKRFSSSVSRTLSARQVASGK